MVGATMGLMRYPYPRYVVWDVTSCTLWSVHTCASREGAGHEPSSTMTE